MQRPCIFLNTILFVGTVHELALSYKGFPLHPFISVYFDRGSWNKLTFDPTVAEP